MASRYALAQLTGGPVAGAVVRAPLRGDDTNLPAQVIGLPVPVLEEDTEQFWWNTANYVPVGAPVRIGSEYGWHFAYARTLPGYPTYTSDAPPDRPVASDWPCRLTPARHRV